MVKESVFVLLKKIVKLLTCGEYDILTKMDIQKRVLPFEIKNVIEKYPGTLSYPPESAFALFDIYEVSNNEIRVDFDLWFDGARSDLTLCCSFYEKENLWSFSIDDIRVL